MEKTYSLVGADGKKYQSAVKGTLGGNKQLKIYGRLDCPNALRWLEQGYYAKNRVFFMDEATAIAAGYRPSKRLLPAAALNCALRTEHTASHVVKGQAISAD